MTDQNTNFITASIDDYLISLADGINVAQRKMSKMVIPGQFGQPSVIYQLPRVDFELKMSFEVVTTESGQMANSASGSSMKLMARPVNPNNSNAKRSTTTEAASTIKGSFVAIPAEGGKPPINIRSVLTRKEGKREIIVTVTVTSAAGETLPGIEVQYNIDHDLMKKLNQNGRVVDPNNKLLEGLVKTDQQGIANNTLIIAATEIKGAHIAITIDVFNERETLIYTT